MNDLRKIVIQSRAAFSDGKHAQMSLVASSTSIDQLIGIITTEDLIDRLVELNADSVFYVCRDYAKQNGFENEEDAWLNFTAFEEFPDFTTGHTVEYTVVDANEDVLNGQTIHNTTHPKFVRRED